MKPMESFLTFYYILDQCYFKSAPADNSDLGSFLGSINSELWEDGRPMDHAVYHEWLAQNDLSALNCNNIITAVLAFLSFYENHGFNFGKTKEILKLCSTADIVEIASKRTNRMYDIFHYPD